jgi:NAD(P) transhydrogenase subunit beta
LGIKFLSHVRTARLGNAISTLAMLAAIAVTAWGISGASLGIFGLSLAMASIAGAIAAQRVKIIAMPQFVALLNGFGGLAGLLVSVDELLHLRSVGWVAHLQTLALTLNVGSTVAIALAGALGIIIGGITFSGSLIAYAKLDGRISKRVIIFPGQRTVRNFLCAAMVILLLFLVLAPLTSHLAIVIAAIATALLLGVFLTLPIGGGDMPIVIAFLNSLSGIAAAMTGFFQANPLIVVTGCLVGASGILLTLIMCRAMNRSLPAVLLGGFGMRSAGTDGQTLAVPISISVEGACPILEAAQRIIIVPGYGMAVSQAQHALKDFFEALRTNGTEVSFVIHPVAGRMPGHMSVLLAEADVPYEYLTEMAEANHTMDQVDVALVIGANDIVNSAAVDDISSPLHGMPVVEVWRARSVLALKRGSGVGFSGMENALFSRSNTRMLFGDAKGTLRDLTTSLRNFA